MGVTTKECWRSHPDNSSRDECFSDGWMECQFMQVAGNVSDDPLDARV